MKWGPVPFVLGFGLGFFSGLHARDSSFVNLFASGAWFRSWQATELLEIAASTPEPKNAAIAASTPEPKIATSTTEPALAVVTASPTGLDKALRDESLCRVAQAAAVDNQVLLLLGDATMFEPPGRNSTLIARMLHSLMALRVNNILLVALDHQGYKHGRRWVEYSKAHISLHVTYRNVPTPAVLANSIPTHQQSPKKFEVLRHILTCGVHVLLSDFDVVFWDNPFKHIVGDADVEAMTDGSDYNTWYGYEASTCCPPPPFYRWAAPWEWRVVFLNSGFFYVQASERTVQTMAATWRMLTRHTLWDQTAFNAQVRAPLGTPAKGRLQGQGLRIRVMSPHKFPNSRVLNEVVDPKGGNSMYDPTERTRIPPFKWPTRARPVAAHMNYHHAHKNAMMAWALRAFRRPGGARHGKRSAR